MKCADCEETDPDVVLMCRDGIARCACHAHQAGWCWGCGDREPIRPFFEGEDPELGLCYDCISADVMEWRRKPAKGRRI